MEWNERQVHELKTLYREGKSASAIAAKMEEMFSIKVTRNMIIGKLHRLFDAGKLEHLKGPRPIKVKPVKVKAERKERRAVSQSYNAAATLHNASLGDNVIMFVPLKAKPKGNGVHLEDVSGCLYATGMDARGRHLFCNSDRKEASAYCEEHHKKCHIQSKPVTSGPPRKWYRS